MAAIVEFRIQSEKLAMTEALQATPDVKLDLLQEAGTDPEQPLLIFWATGGDLDAFESALEDDETVTDIERYSTVGDRSLYRIRITDAVELVTYPVWVDVGAEQIEVHYRDGWWYNKYRLPNTEALVALESWCDEHDVKFELDGVFSQEGSDNGAGELTVDQREILQTAYDMGYFEIPREGTLEDVATVLDISTQAASERLRRGHRRLIQQRL